MATQTDGAAGGSAHHISTYVSNLRRTPATIIVSKDALSSQGTGGAFYLGIKKKPSSLVVPSPYAAPGLGFGWVLERGMWEFLEGGPRQKRLSEQMPLAKNRIPEGCRERNQRRGTNRYLGPVALKKLGSFFKKKGRCLPGGKAKCCRRLGERNREGSRHDPFGTAGGEST